MDNFYPIEIKIASKNGWSTPQEARYIWSTPYARSGITIHHWGGGEGANKHDNIVNYFLSQAAAGNKSTNYVGSDNKITLMVSPDNVAWCSNNGNPTTISIELQPTLGAEGYKKCGWLVAQLEERYGRTLQLFPHSYWTATACPGNIDLNRIRSEADKWKRGEYTQPKPDPKPTPAPTIQVTHSVLPTPIMYKLKNNANLWNYNAATWSDFKVIKSFNKGDTLTVYAIADNHNVGAKYGVTEYSYSKGITNGVNMVDLELAAGNPQPIPMPPPVQSPDPVPEPGTVIKPDPEQPDWDELFERVQNAVAALAAAVKAKLK